MVYRSPDYPKKDIVVRRYGVVMVYNDQSNRGRSTCVDYTVVSEDGSKAVNYVRNKLRKEGSIRGEVDVWATYVFCAEDLFVTEDEVTKYSKEGIFAH